MKTIECDFCSVDLEEAKAHRERAVDFLSHTVSTKDIGHVSRGDWAACDLCHDLIVKDDWDGLALRSAETFTARYPGMDTVERATPFFRKLHDEFRRARLT